MNLDSNQDTSTERTNNAKLKGIRFVPLSDRIVVIPDTAEEITAAGIIIPDTNSKASAAPTTGIVIAVGPGRYSDGANFISSEDQNRQQFITKQQPLPMNVKVKDRVMWSKFAGSVITIDNVDCTIMHESDLIGIITE